VKLIGYAIIKKTLFKKEESFSFMNDAKRLPQKSQKLNGPPMVLGLLREFAEACEKSDFNTNLRDRIEILHSRIKNGVGMFYRSLVCERATKKDRYF
jgi:hypothetical protein